MKATTIESSVRMVRSFFRFRLLQIRWRNFIGRALSRPSAACWSASSSCTPDFAQGEHLGQLGLAEGGLFAGALQFDEFARGVHDEVQIHLRRGVFRVAKIQQGLLLDDADADGGDGAAQRVCGQLAFGHQLADRQGERHVAAGNGRGAGAAVGLQDIAVHPDGAGAQFLQVDGGAHGPADEALDFLGAPVNLALGDVALFALQGGVGEHRVFGRDPAPGDALLLHPARHGFLDRHAADHARVAPFDQRRAGGVRRDVVLETHGAQLSRPNGHRRAGAEVTGADSGCAINARDGRGACVTGQRRKSRAVSGLTLASCRLR